ncbi:MAG: PASTA domain-containing protein, partial [Chitinophagaceae bacterium]|nr:PASTA domain-containing protein [Chitinophagaceae bacterium]
KNKQGAVKYHGSEVAAPVFKEIADRLYTTFLRKSQSQQVMTKSLDSISVRWVGNKNDLQRISRSMSIALVDSSDNWTEWADLKGSLRSGMVRGKAIPENEMPSLVGMGLKDALQLAENRGLMVRIQGRGKVLNQSIPAGDKIIKGQVLRIQLTETLTNLP